MNENTSASRSRSVSRSFAIAATVFGCIALIGAPVSVEANGVEIASPGGNIRVSVAASVQGHLTYAVTEGGASVLMASPLGIVADGEALGDAVQLGKVSLKKIDEKYPVCGNHAMSVSRATEASIPVSSHGKNWTLQVRVQDDGVAVRYTLPSGTKHIEREDTAWILPDTVKSAAWQEFSNCYEANDHYSPWTDIPQGKQISGFLTPVLSDHTLFLSEANNADFPDFSLTRENNTVRPVWYASAKGFDVDPSVPVITPWRITSIARDLTALVNSDLIINLCPPPDKKYDFSFVKPGRILWQWCSVGAPKYEDQKNWYDATAALKWEYYMIDDGWRDWRKPGFDQWQLLKEVIDYGKTKGVPTFAWVNSKEMQDARSRRAYLEKVAASGAVGIKIDFIPNADANVMKWYDDTLRDTAELKLMTVFHGCVKPTGRERHWPHALTREGVRGNEWQMTRYKRLLPMDHDVVQPFTRFLAGAGDITPMVLDPVQLRGYTWAHEFAQEFTTLSPCSCCYDQYKFLVGNPAQDLFAQFPVTWDETRVLPGTKIGETIGFARRKGSTWWIGIVNGGQDANFNILLNFLSGKSVATLLYDDKQEDDAFDRKETPLGPSDTLTLKLRKGGGFVGRFALSP